MKKQKIFLTGVLLLLSIHLVIACSMFKITMNGKTMAGYNVDQWELTSKIWFEKGVNNLYGAVYSGTFNKSLPGGGMNECGLAFGGLTVPTRILKDQSNKKDGIEINGWKKVMQKCRNIDEAYSMLAQYDMSFLNGAMFVFVDREGKYLIVEADTLIKGNDQKYVLSNFCPSVTKDLSKVKIQRYIKGRNFLENKSDTSLSSCEAMMDTMHQCRAKIGDGTLYTTIYDLNEGILYLYFYHDFKQRVVFNLKKELEKGDHELEMPPLFPSNNEYRNLCNYLTPQNSSLMSSFFNFSGLLLLFSSLFFLVDSFRNRKVALETKNNYLHFKLILFAISSILLYYLSVLKNNQAIFYFPAPYKDYKFSMLNIAAYIPFLLLILIIPLFKMNLKLFKETAWNKFSKWLFTLNNLTYLTFIVLFAYWGLYNIF